MHRPWLFIAVGLSCTSMWMVALYMVGGTNQARQPTTNLVAQHRVATTVQHQHPAHQQETPGLRAVANDQEPANIEGPKFATGTTELLSIPENPIAQGHGNRESRTMLQETLPPKGPLIPAVVGTVFVVLGALGGTILARVQSAQQRLVSQPLLKVVSDGEKSPASKPEADRILLSRRQFQASAVALTTVPALPAVAASAPGVPSSRLGSLKVSQIIQGHWQLAGGHGREPFDDPSANMRNHYNAGITTFDTADIYGGSQQFIGQYLASDRPEDAVVCTKFCCFNGLDRIDRNYVRRAIKSSINQLGVKQLDLVAFFWADFKVQNYVQTGLYLKELKEEGLIKEIGVTNFDVKHLAELVDAGVPVVSNQVQYSLVDRRPENGLLNYCNEHDIKVIAFGTVAAGYLSDKYLGAPRPGQISNYSESLYSTSIGKAGGWKKFQELLGVLDSIAKKHEVTIANVASRWVLQHREVAAIIIGVRNSKHIQENVNIFSFELDDEDLLQIQTVLQKQNPPQGDIWFRERGLV
jgi:aryl-alcohol dehydrogenase-like predicted oxidoreductase